MRIALLEDDEEVALWVIHILEAGGHGVDRFARGSALLRRCASESYDLFILDWELPDITGIEVLRTMRTQLVTQTPVLFLTHREGEADVVAALESGADDYLVKPPREQELLARIRVLARRGRETRSTQAPIAVGPYQIDPEHQQVLRNGQPVELAPREFQVALMLFQNVGKVISRAHLLLSIWGNATTTPSRTVDTHVSRVRVALGLSAANGVRLTPVYGYGYRLEAVPREVA